MIHFNNFNPGCWLYLGLHGSYGLVWVLKSYTISDICLQQPLRILNSIATALVLILYWIPAYLQVTGQGIQYPSQARIALCVFLIITGSALMVGSDTQKNITLMHKKGLIKDGFFKYTRSPNYLGEIMIYSSFAICVGIPKIYVLFIAMWVILLGTFIYTKEKSNSTKKGWDSYTACSWALLPKIVPSSSWLSIEVYLVMLVISYNLYQFS